MSKEQGSKFKMRLLPAFIFVAVLSLSIKVNHAYDLYRKTLRHDISIVATAAVAEEKADKDTVQLTEVLQKKSNSDGVNELPTFSDSEIALLQELAERREALEVKSQEIDKRAVQLKVAEEEIDKKIKQLKEYEQRLGKLINQYSDKEQENINSLVKLYSSMKPKDAARIFNTMNLDISTAILKGMKPSASSAILSQMDSEKAQAITAELIGNNI